MKTLLYQPQIPQNTGNIIRTCAVTGSDLILVKPLGFSVSNRRLKRAGLDYWEGVNVILIDDLMTFLENTQSRILFFSSHATTHYTEATYEDDTCLVFGSETKGLPEELWKRWPEKFYTIPQRKGVRCLNLANAVSIVLYEGWRQQGFSNSHT